MKYLSLTINDKTIDTPPGVPTGGLETLNIISGNAISIILAFVSVLVVFYIIYAGIQWSMSGGDKQKVQASRNKIIYAILGLIVIVLSAFIINIVLFFLGQKPV